MTRTNNHDWQMPEVGGDTNTWGNILNALFQDMDNQIILDGPLNDRPPGDNTDLVYYHDTDESIIYYNDNEKWVPISGVSEQDTFSYVSGHTGWEPGLVDEEIHRFSVESDERFSLVSLEFREKGGGTENTDCSFEVFDNTLSQQMASVNLNDKIIVDAESDLGASVLFRITNNTNDTVKCSITARGSIE